MMSSNSKRRPDEFRSHAARLATIVVAVAIFALACLGTNMASAEALPPPPVSVTLPAPADNAFGVSVAFGPTDGLMYVWDGAAVLKQDGFNGTEFPPIGSVGSGSSDAGPITFSRDNSTILVGNGFGGSVGGTDHAGKIFTMSAAGSNDPGPFVGTVDLHNAFLAAPIGTSQTRYFVDAGADQFGTTSSVSVFDSSNGTNKSVIVNIPGASTSGMAIAGGSTADENDDRLYVGIGFGPYEGELRSFLLADLTDAYNAASPSPLDWSAGTLFNDKPNNRGTGMFFDARGYLFVGGPDGVTVFDALGNFRTYDNGGYTQVTYDPANDRFLVTGFGNEQGIYPASMFSVPEPESAALVVMAALTLISANRLRRPRRSRASRAI
jgi:hypothetical protein